MLKLLIEKPHMIRANIDVIDGLINGAIGVLHYVEYVNPDDGIKRLWFSLADQKIGRFVHTKCKAHVASNANLHKSWVPIGKRTATITLNSKIVLCKRNQFPLVEACVIMFHKSQGGTYDSVIYEYDKAHEQQLVYVALSRATSLEGLYLTNKNSDYTFHHARDRANTELKGEFQWLENHKLDTILEVHWTGRTQSYRSLVAYV